MIVRKNNERNQFAPWIATIILWAMIIPQAHASLWDSIKGYLATPENDGAFIFLQRLFGNMVCAFRSQCEAQEHTAITYVLIATTSVLMAAIFTVLATIVFKSLLAGASSGSLFIQRDKQEKILWPIRTIVGLIMICPTPFGLTVIQLLVIAVTLMGISLGNLGWSKFVDFVGTGGMSSSGALISNDNHRLLASQILKNEICMHTFYKEMQQAGMAPTFYFTDGMVYQHGKLIAVKSKYKNNVSNTQGADYREISWGINGFPAGICGHLIYPASVPEIKPRDIYEAQKTKDKNDPISLMSNEMYKTSDRLTRELVLNLRTIAKNIVTDESKNALGAHTSQFMHIMDKYDNKISESITKIYLSYDKSIITHFKENAKQGGWIYAGAWFWRLSNIQSRIEGAVQNIVPQISAGPIDTELPPSLIQKIEDNLGRVDAINKRINPTGGIAAEAQAIKDNENGIFQNMVTYLREHLVPIANAQGVHPFVSLVSMGKVLINSVLALMVGGAILAAFFSSLKIFSGIFTAVMGILLVTGGWLSYYLPIMPFLVFMLGVLGWLAYVIQSMISAPIWAVLHLMPEGTGITGMAQEGYLQLLNLLLRPLLLILGTIAGYEIFIVMVGWLNSIYFNMMTLSSMGNLFDFIWAFVLYVMLVSIIARPCFALIYMIPDLIPRSFFATNYGHVSPHAEEGQRDLMLIANYMGTPPQLKIPQKNGESQKTDNLPPPPFQQDSDGDKLDMASEDHGHNSPTAYSEENNDPPSTSQNTPTTQPSAPGGQPDTPETITSMDNPAASGDNVGQEPPRKREYPDDLYTNLFGGENSDSLNTRFNELPDPSKEMLIGHKQAGNQHIAEMQLDFLAPKGGSST